MVFSFNFLKFNKMFQKAERTVYVQDLGAEI